MSQPKFLTRFIIPLLVFPSLTALAVKHVLLDGITPALKAELIPRCSVGTAFALSYTGITGVDRILCNLVSFFSAAFDANLKYTIWLAGQLVVLPAFTFLEAGRPGRSIALSAVAVTLYGYLYQRYTAGVVFNIYWLLFVVTGQANRRAPISSSHASATLFATILGYVIPSIALVSLRESYSNAFWQPFPLWMFIIQRLALLVLPKNDKTSGKRQIQLTYLLGFLGSALPHVHALITLGADYTKLAQHFIPRKIGPTEPITAAQGALNFLQWDGVFIVIPALIVTLWFARSAKELVLVLLWNFVGSLAFGPAAAVSALFAWREERLSH